VAPSPAGRLWQTSGVKPVALHHVSINVRDVPDAFAFYTETLGLAPRTDRPDFGFGGAWLDVGGQQVHLIEGAVPDGLGQHFAVEVSDLDATVAELRQHGVRVSDPKPVGPNRQAFLRDPSGNSIELQEVGGRPS
jgi:glyoxylase I family protein